MNPEKIKKYALRALIIAGIIIRFVYIIKTDCYERQYDVYGYYGHMKYIAIIFNTGSFPDEITWQFYQPPLWHMLCALWMKLQQLLGIESCTAMENIQLLSFFFSSLMVLISKKLFEQFGLRGREMMVGIALVAFHPSLIILSGSINNDCMSASLSLLSVLLAVKWYKSPSMKKIILLGLSLGLSMGAKLNGGLVSLGIAMLFAVKFFDKSCKKESVAAQLAVFGAVCVPLALWWQLRSYILFRLPFSYVPRLSEDIPQYLGEYSVAQRLFDPSSLWKWGVYPAMGERNGAEFYEYNILLGGLKSSLFGENFIDNQNMLFYAVSVVLFLAAFLLFAFGCAFGIYNAISNLKNRKKELFIESFPLVCGGTLIFFYIIFCFKYPHFCSMDFRYITLVSVFTALYVGLLIKKQKNNNKMFGFIISNFLMVITVLFCISSGLLYLGIS